MSGGDATVIIYNFYYSQVLGGGIQNTKNYYQ